MLATEAKKSDLILPETLSASITNYADLNPTFIAPNCTRVKEFTTYCNNKKNNLRINYKLGLSSCNIDGVACLCSLS